MKKLLTTLLAVAILFAFTPFIDNAYASSKYEIYYSGAMKVISAEGIKCSIDNQKGLVTVYGEGTITIKMKNERFPKAGGVIEVLRAKSLDGFYDGSCKKVGTFNVNKKGYVTAEFKIGGSLKCYAINWWESLPGESGQEGAGQDKTENNSTAHIIFCKSGDISFTKVSGISYSKDGDCLIVNEKGTATIEAESSINDMVLKNVSVKSGYLANTLDDVTYDTDEGTFVADESGKVIITLNVDKNRAYHFSAEREPRKSEAPAISSPSDITSPTDSASDTNTPASDTSNRVKELLDQVSVKASVKYSSNDNIIATAKIAEGKSSIDEIERLGYTVQYKYYRSTKSGSKYSLKKTSTKSSYTDKSGKKGQKYYYKITLSVVDGTGEQVCAIPLSNVNCVSKKWKK